MSRFSPTVLPVATPSWTEHLLRAANAFNSAREGVRERKRQDEQDARDKELYGRRLEQMDYEREQRPFQQALQEAAARQQGVYRGAAPIDAGSVMSGAKIGMAGLAPQVNRALPDVGRISPSLEYNPLRDAAKRFESSRYEMLGPDFYIDRERTPDAREQAKEEAQRAWQRALQGEQRQWHIEDREDQQAFTAEQNRLQRAAMAERGPSGLGGQPVVIYDTNGQALLLNKGTGLASPIQKESGGMVGKYNPQLEAASRGTAKNLAAIDEAMQLVTDRPNSFGLERGRGFPLVSGVVDNRLDPDGAAARAAVGNIGSLIIRDRSGAAVTAAEFPRLQPFIPQISDPPQIIQTKLAQLRREYERIQTEEDEARARSMGMEGGTAVGAAIDNGVSDNARARGETSASRFQQAIGAASTTDPRIPNGPALGSNTLQPTALAGSRAVTDQTRGAGTGGTDLYAKYGIERRKP